MTSIEINFEPRTIVHVSGGSFAGQKQKDRYYLILSTYSRIPANDTFVCLPISTWEGEDPFMIKINDADMERGSFTKPSQVVCEQINTFMKNRADDEKGKVTQLFYTKVKNILKEKILDIT